MSEPINTNVRLFDLVRFMRAELHDANLITDEEYAWLCGGAPMANDPKGGSPSPRRLEDYDDLRSKLQASEALVACFRVQEQGNIEIKAELWAKLKACEAALSKAREALKNILVSSKWSGTPPTAYATIAREALAKLGQP